jgi:hypothetical protein
MAEVVYVRTASRLGLAPDQAQVELAKAARELLLGVASKFRATITDRELAANVQRRARISVSGSDDWLGEILKMVVHVCHQIAEPPLTSLVVRSEDGHVGEVFDEVRRTQELPLVSDDAEREEVAAMARLDCYRRFAPEVPADAKPTAPTQSAAASRRVAGSRARPTVRPRRDPSENRAPFVLCPSCFIQTPPGVECQNCGTPL